jgi:hypothetical protein
MPPTLGGKSLVTSRCFRRSSDDPGDGEVAAHGAPAGQSRRGVSRADRGARGAPPPRPRAHGPARAGGPGRRRAPRPPPAPARRRRCRAPRGRCGADVPDPDPTRTSDRAGRAVRRRWTAAAPRAAPTRSPRPRSWPTGPDRCARSAGTPPGSRRSRRCGRPGRCGTRVGTAPEPAPAMRGNGGRRPRRGRRWRRWGSRRGNVGTDPQPSSTGAVATGSGASVTTEPSTTHEPYPGTRRLAFFPNHPMPARCAMARSTMPLSSATTTAFHRSACRRSAMRRSPARSGA